MHPLGDVKQRTRIALSALDREKCVVITRGEACGACAEVCATRALRMEPLQPGLFTGAAPGLTAPVLDPEYCIGCGGCFHVCPAEPRAFVVTGVTPQVVTPGIRPSDSEEENADIPVWSGDFPF
jgi:ferredoxin